MSKFNIVYSFFFIFTSLILVNNSIKSKELKANQKYEKVIEKVKKTEEKLFELREKKRQMAADIHNKYHQPNEILVAGN